MFMVRAMVYTLRGITEGCFERAKVSPPKAVGKDGDSYPFMTQADLTAKQLEDFRVHGCLAYEVDIPAVPVQTETPAAKGKTTKVEPEEVEETPSEEEEVAETPDEDVAEQPRRRRRA